jgi:hypothetical protein
MQRMPSSLRSKIQSGSLKRSSVRTAFIASARSGAGAGRTSPRSASLSASSAELIVCSRSRSY